MPSVPDLLRDPEFRKLSPDAQLYGLQSSDADFAKLSQAAQMAALEDPQFHPGPALPGTEKTGLPGVPTIRSPKLNEVGSINLLRGGEEKKSYATPQDTAARQTVGSGMRALYSTGVEGVGGLIEAAGQWTGLDPIKTLGAAVGSVGKTAAEAWFQGDTDGKDFIDDPNKLTDPGYLGRLFGGAVGSMGGIMGTGAGAAGAATRAAKFLKLSEAAAKRAALTGGVAGASLAEVFSQSGHDYYDALSHGASADTAAIVAAKSAGLSIGPTLALNAAGYWNPNIKGAARRQLLETFGEVAQEEMQQAASNVAAREYDPNRPALQGGGEAALGAVVASGVGEAIASGSRGAETQVTDSMESAPLDTRAVPVAEESQATAPVPGTSDPQLAELVSELLPNPVPAEAAAPTSEGIELTAPPAIEEEAPALPPAEVAAAPQVEPTAAGTADWDKRYQPAAKTVDGRVVRRDVPNTGSIGASFDADQYEVLKGIREIPLSEFDAPPANTARARSLAEQIKESGEINPLIVAIDKEGPYILEGANRYDALRLMGAKSFPALVVVDTSNQAPQPEPEPQEPAVPRETKAKGEGEANVDLPEQILETAAKVEPQAGMLVTMRQLREELGDEVPKAEFDAAVLDLAKQGKLTLAEHSDPLHADLGERETLIRTEQKGREDPVWYGGVSVPATPAPETASQKLRQKAAAAKAETTAAVVSRKAKLTRKPAVPPVEAAPIPAPAATKAPGAEALSTEMQAALMERAKAHTALSRLNEQRKNVGTLRARDVPAERTRIGQAMQVAESALADAQAKVDRLATIETAKPPKPPEVRGGFTEKGLTELEQYGRELAAHHRAKSISPMKRAEVVEGRIGFGWRRAGLSSRAKDSLWAGYKEKAADPAQEEPDQSAVSGPRSKEIPKAGNLTPFEHTILNSIGRDAESSSSVEEYVAEQPDYTRPNLDNGLAKLLRLGYITRASIDGEAAFRRTPSGTTRLKEKPSLLKRLATEETGSIDLGKVSKGLQDAYDVVVKPLGTRMRESSERLGVMMDRARDTGDVIAGGFVNRVIDAKLPKLSRAERFELLDHLEGQGTSKNPKILDAAKVVRGLTDDVAGIAVNLGVQLRTSEGRGQFVPMDDYFPHVFRRADAMKSGPVRQDIIENLVRRKIRPDQKTAGAFLDEYVDFLENGKPKQQLIDHLVQSGKAKDPAAAVDLLRSFRQSTRRHGSLEYAREVDLPFYDPDPARVLPWHMATAGQRLAQIATFGQDDQAIKKELGEIAKADGNDVEVQKWVDRRLKGVEDGDTAEERVSRFVRSVQTLKLGLAFIPNATQPMLNIPVAGDFRALAAGYKALFSEQGRRFAVETGAAIEPVLHESHQSLGAGRTGRTAETILKPFQAVEQSNRIIAANAGAEMAGRLFATLKSKPLSRRARWARLRLADLGINTQAALQRGSLTRGEILMAGKKFSDLTQFRSRPEEMPVWASTWWGKVIGQFKTFAYNQSRFVLNETIGELTRGEPLRAGRNVLLMAGLAGGLGELVRVLRNGISQRDEEPEGLERYAKNLAAVGAGGIALDAIRAVEGYRELEWAAGPAASMGVDLGQLGWAWVNPEKTLDEKVEKTKKVAIRHMPFGQVVRGAVEARP